MAVPQDVPKLALLHTSAVSCNRERYMVLLARGYQGDIQKSLPRSVDLSWSLFEDDYVTCW